MKTQTEIVERLKEVKNGSFFGWEWDDYLRFLSFEHAKPFLLSTATPTDWNDDYKEPTSENILKLMLGYMPFAFEKANNCRGISSNRSIAHYESWLWLLDDDFLKEFNAIEYEHYGKEKLISICEKYGWDWKQWDNGIRTNTDD